MAEAPGTLSRMAAGMTNTLRQVGTATGGAVFGALYASRVTAASLRDLADPTRAAAARAAHTATASGLNDVLLAAAAFAALGVIVGLAFGPDRGAHPGRSVHQSRRRREGGLGDTPDLD